ncbi:hypothetical protein O0L34_g1345 [Tuta absoluta]|nr:hypothetical protein O0L34_g1345 [Tuta absoluta]
MEECNADLISIETRHRKEKKELQAHIQALKKAAKNDKNKKKDLVSEIARLEAEQDTRHKQELEAVEQNAPSADIVNEIENELPKLKISKAQKRRDKKQQQEKEREEQIKLQEKENINGPRNTEVQAISERLKKKNLKIFLVPSDGDCLYKAVAHQLETIKHQKLSISDLRTHVAEHIKSNKDDFRPFMSTLDTCGILTDNEFEEYCDKIATTKVWGGQLEIKALSSSLKCPISVIQATGPESIEQGAEFQGPPLVITYHRHMYSLGEHYNSTCPNINSEDD